MKSNVRNSATESGTTVTSSQVKVHNSCDQCDVALLILLRLGLRSTEYALPRLDCRVKLQ